MDNRTLTAFFLCAGYGQRLRPLTDRIPKPLIPFQGISALEWNFRAAQKLMAAQSLVNAHHLPENVEMEARRLGMPALYEREIMGTGGCLWNARHLLTQTDGFLVHNADLVHNIDLVQLYEEHKRSGNIATLGALFRPAINSLSCSQGMQLLGVHQYQEFDHRDEMTRLTFSGIAFYNREFLQFVEPGCEDIKAYWVKALEAGERIGLVNLTHTAAWYDFGTPQGLWDTARFMMEATGEYSFNYYPLLREPRPYIANEAGQDDLPEALRNVLVMEESATPIMPGTADRIIGRDFQWEIVP